VYMAWHEVAIVFTFVAPSKKTRGNVSEERRKYVAGNAGRARDQRVSREMSTRSSKLFKPADFD